VTSGEEGRRRGACLVEKREGGGGVSSGEEGMTVRDYRE